MTKQHVIGAATVLGLLVTLFVARSRETSEAKEPPRIEENDNIAVEVLAPIKGESDRSIWRHAESAKQIAAALGKPVTFHFKFEDGKRVSFPIDPNAETRMQVQDALLRTGREIP